MSILSRIKNAFVPGDAETEQLLEWLGIDRNDPKAISETTYFTCLKVLSETMGKLPLKYYQSQPGGGRTRADPGQGAALLMDRPNPYMTPAVFWSVIETACQHWGNAYVWIDRVFLPKRWGGDVVINGFWPMRSECVTIYIDDAGIFGDEGRLYYKYTDPQSGREYIFKNNEIMHFKNWLTWDGIVGKSVRDILRETVEGASYSQDFLNNLNKSGLTSAAVLQYTENIDEKRRKKLQERYNEYLTGARNAGKVVAIPSGLQLTPLNYKLTDAQFLELKKYSALQIAAAFGVKPNQINNYEKSSYANSEMQQLAFLVDTMLYRVSQYEQEINYKVLDQKERLNGCFFKFNEKVILRTNTKEQMEAITAAVQNGIYTPNEGRSLLDLPSADGGDELIVNGNCIPLTRVGDAYPDRGGDNGDSEN
jgi:HK97 family phage portal protein